MADESSDIGHERVRVYSLRRRDGPTWEVLEDYDSRRLALADAEERHRTARLFKPNPEEIEKLRKHEWEQVDFPTLEVSYQRFLHHYRDKCDWPRTPIDRAKDKLRKLVEKRDGEISGATI